MKFSELKNLIDTFYSTLQTNVTEKPPKKIFNIKPSGVGAKCLRKIYYGGFGVSKDYDVSIDIKKMGRMGDGLETILNNAFRNQKILIEYRNPDGSMPLKFGVPNLEFPINSEVLRIKSGFVDNVIVLENKLWLSEYKSCTANSFTNLREPKPEHLIQATIYLFVFNNLLKKGAYKHIKELAPFTEAAGMRWLYVDRDNMVDFHMKEFPYTRKQLQPVFRKIINKINTLIMYADAKKLPPKTDNWCNSCEYREKCAENYNLGAA